MTPLNWKPYRLMGESERFALLQTFSHRLQEWNEPHALIPLSCDLALFTHWVHQDHSELTDAGVVIGRMVMTDSSLIKRHCFGDEAACFDEVSDTLFMRLLQHLLDAPGLKRDLQPVDIDVSEWFYKGAPSLVLTVNHAVTLYLHPEWVMSALSANIKSQKPLASLQSALESQSIELQLCLTPLTLKLDELSRLQVGDVIKTDHLTATPLLLMHHHTSVASAEMGHQTIQITRKP